MKSLTLATCLIAGLSGLGQAQAATLNLSCISVSNIIDLTTDCSNGEAQLSIAVQSTLKGVSFTFTNNNLGSPSSITEIYFDANASSLTGIPLPMITDSDGVVGNNVAFSLTAVPSNLPGANNITPPFSASTTTAFTADANGGPGGQMMHGVNTESEWLTMDYSLRDGKTYADVLNDLATGNLRIGLHVTGFGDGYSASFVNAPLAVPVPAAAWLLGSGLIGLVGIGRRKD